MISSISSPSPKTSSPAETGFDYVSTEAHYFSLACRISAALCDGRLVLVTGEPPASLRLISGALTKTVKSRHTVVEIACSQGLNTNQLYHAAREVGALAAAGGAAVPVGKVADSAAPLFVFDEIERLSDEEIRQLCDTVAQRAEEGAAGVLLAGPNLVRRLDEPSLSFLKEALVARFRLDEIGEDESIDFLRHQLEMRHRDDEQRHVSPIVFRRLAALGVGAAICIATFFAVRFLLHMPGQPTAGTETGTYSAAPPSLAARPPPAPAPVAGLSAPAPPAPSASASPVAATAAPPAPASPRMAAAAPPAPAPPATAAGTPSAPAPPATVAAAPPAPASLRMATAAPSAPAPPATAATAPSAPAPPATAAAASPAPASPRMAAAAPPAPAPPVTAATAPSAPAPTAAATAAPPAPAPPVTAATAPSAPAPTAAATAAPFAPALATPPPRPISPSPSPAASPSQSPPGERPHSQDFAALVTRGDAFLSAGDIASARLFYERAADAGDGSAALRLGATFDPGFLSRAGVRGTPGDPARAASWYRRALELGETTAAERLKNLDRTVR